ncbi:helix-turn-helix transcriptional regulator [Flavobacterium sp. j3]|uniref:Helix-turn-helix transcriptional regulator n=1 Tax=Flavobacterium aureirubrum TaxID=3133147 RepID=A0ABU9N0A4_9FLAO
MANYLKNIKEFREKIGYSLEYMGIKLDISSVSYSKIEKGETKLTIDRLYTISEILNVSISQILDIEVKNEIHQTNNETAIGSLKRIENFYQENKEQNLKIIELYEQRLKEKDVIIELLKIKS